MSEQPSKKKSGAETPAWVVTFADLMSLLMCFFVMLLSFSELDLLKFKQISGALKYAFGVQRDIKAMEIPMGTSVITTEFSAGRPDPTVLNEVRQHTMDDTKQTLEFTDALVQEDDGTEREEQEDGGGAEEDGAGPNPQTLTDAQKLLEALLEEVNQGMIQIEARGGSIVLRIRERGSFPSGSDRLNNGFSPVIDKVHRALRDIEGQIEVAGHTDNVPITGNARFRSNWDLSAARAVTVVHELIERGGLAPERFVVEGRADTQPVVPNDSPENRALNRRVELTIVQQGQMELGNRSTVVTILGGDDAAADPVPSTARVIDPGILDEIRLQ